MSDRGKGSATLQVGGNRYIVWTNLPKVAIDAVSVAIFAKWAEFALGLSSLGKRLKDPSGRYASSLRLETDQGPNAVGIIADTSIAPEADIIEFGHQAIDLKQSLAPGKTYPMHRPGGEYKEGATHDWVVPAMTGYHPGFIFARMAAKMLATGDIPKSSFNISRVKALPKMWPLIEIVSLAATLRSKADSRGLPTALFTLYHYIMPISVTGQVCAAGGIVTLSIGGYSSASGAQMTISRAVSGNAYGLIYSGGVLPFYVDIGDPVSGTNVQPGLGLGSGTQYLWQIVDASGTVVVGPLTPTPNLSVEVDFFTPLLINLLTVGINNVTRPEGIKLATVYHDLPLGSFPILPIISVSQELVQQDAIGIGQNIENPIPFQNGMWSMPALARRIWRICVFARDVITREFYRDACIQIWQSLLPTVFIGLGQNVSHKFQAHNTQWIEDLKDIYPGIYMSEIMVEMTGLFDVSVQRSYPPVQGVLVGIEASGVASPGFYGTVASPIFVSGLVSS